MTTCQVLGTEACVLTGCVRFRAMPCVEVQQTHPNKHTPEQDLGGSGIHTHVCELCVITQHSYMGVCVW